MIRKGVSRLCSIFTGKSLPTTTAATTTASATVEQHNVVQRFNGIYPIYRSNAGGMTVQHVLPPCTYRTAVSVPLYEKLTWRMMPLIGANNDPEVQYLDVSRGLEKTMLMIQADFRDIGHTSMLDPVVTFLSDQDVVELTFTPVVFGKPEKKLPTIDFVEPTKIIEVIPTDKIISVK